MYHPWENWGSIRSKHSLFCGSDEGHYMDEQVRFSGSLSTVEQMEEVQGRCCGQSTTVSVQTVGFERRAAWLRRSARFLVPVSSVASLPQTVTFPQSLLQTRWFLLADLGMRHEWTALHWKEFRSRSVSLLVQMALSDSAWENIRELWQCQEWKERGICLCYSVVAICYGHSVNIRGPR